MPPRRDLNFISLSDFSPGIWNRTNYTASATTVAPFGAASPANTFRCIALQGGGLGPLPAREASFANPSIPDTGNLITYFVSGFWANRVFDVDTGALGPIAFHLASEYEHPDGLGVGVPERRYRWQRFFQGGGSTTVKSINTGATAAPFQPRFTAFGDQRLHPTVQTTPGIPVTFGGWYGDPNDPPNRFVAVFPAPATPTTDSALDISVDEDPSIVFAHQGRIVWNRRMSEGQGAGGAETFSTNNLRWTNVNLPTVVAGTTVVVPQALALVDAESLSAGELFVMTPTAGGLTLNGDLDNFTEFSLPNLAHMTNNNGLLKGAHSSVGYICYTGDAGAYAWAGGDTMAHISPQLDPNFAIPTDATFRGAQQGRMARWYDWVLFANNWVFDTQLESWWRIENPVDQVLRHWVAPRHDRVFGACSSYTDAAPTCIFAYKRDTAAESYSWESHYLFVTQDRTANFRELVLMAQGANQTITVTLTDPAGNTKVVAFTIDSLNNPILLRADISLQAPNIKVKIEADGSANSNAAAIIHRLDIGMDERMMVANI